MTQEIVRELVDGEWVTRPKDVTGGSGSGTVEEITSDDESVTITNPTGPTVDLSVSGGSLPELVVMTFTATEIAARFNGDDGFAAVEVDTSKMAPGDVFLWCWEEPGSTLDQGAEFAGFYGFTPDASTHDVNDQASIVANGPIEWADSDYVGVAAEPGLSLYRLPTGIVAYAMFASSVAPTEGEVTVTVVVLRRS